MYIETGNDSNINFYSESLGKNNYIAVNKNPGFDIHLVQNSWLVNNYARKNTINGMNSEGLYNLKEVVVNNDPTEETHQTGKIFISDSFLSKTSYSTDVINLLLSNENGSDLDNHSLINVKSVTFNKKPTEDNLVATKKFVDDNFVSKFNY